MAALTLSEIMGVLGVSKTAASQLRAGKYQRTATTLPDQYQALVKIVENPSTRAICVSCPRSDCTGCRIKEMDK